MEFSGHKYQNGLPFPSLGGLPDPGIEPASPALQADSLLCEIPGMPYKCTSFIVTLWTVACQAPLSMEFSKKEYWSGLPFPSPGGLPNSGIEPGSPALQILYHLSPQERAGLRTPKSWPCLDEGDLISKLPDLSEPP